MKPRRQNFPPPGVATSPRAVALDLLGAILDRRRALEECFESHPLLASGGLAARDRGFVRLIVATTLRRLGQIDAALDACLARTLTPKARGARNLLRLGACQLLFLATPPHAAVAETVALATGRLAAYRALANAVLRRLAREGASLLAAQDAPRLNIPEWLWQSWVASYGEVSTRAIAAALLAEPPLDLTLKTSDTVWAHRLGGEMLPTGTLRLREPRAITELAGFAEGAWWVQDAGAALPARLFGDLAGRTVIDLCAAPGGKTAQLAAAGAQVVAVDRSPARLDRIRRNLQRLGLSCELVAADAVTWRPALPATHVLLDAPCTATGTARRHPDVLRIKGREDVERLAVAQDQLLDAASAMLALGGTLVYSTCSLEPEEGPQRIDALLARDARLARRPIAPGELAGLAELVTPGGDLRTLPCHLSAHGGLDGFYAARLVRTD